MVFRQILILAVLVGMSAAALAAGEEKTPIRRAIPQQSAQQPVAGSSSSGATLVFLGVLLAGAIVVRRAVQHRRKGRERAGRHGSITMLSHQQVDEELTIRVLQVGTRVLIIGSTAQGLATLMECTDPAEIARITGQKTSIAAEETLFPGQSEIRSAPASPFKAAAVSAMVMLFLVAISGAAVGQSSVTIDVLSPDVAFPAQAQPSFVVAELTVPQLDEGAALAATRIDASHGESEVADGALSALLSPQQITPSLRTVVLIGVLSLVPAVLVMSTCFARMAIVFGLLRQGLGAQQWLPNQIVLALSLFLTFFVMAPVWTRSYEDGIKPYVNGHYETSAQQQAAFDVALERAVGPLREFMSTQIAATGNEAAIDMLMSYDPQRDGESQVPQYYEDVPLQVLLPAYLLSELKTAFVIGIQVVLPFLVIDFVVASVLTGMGLMMMSPVLVSLPFKLLLFVLIDGWTLTVEMLLRSLPVT